jgi:hypothetical protein
MQTVSTVFGQALRSAHTVVSQVDAFMNGQPFMTDIPILDDGSVSIQSGTGVRRTLDVTLADQSLWSAFDVTGIELVPYRGIQYPSGDVELVKLGTFGVDSINMSVGPDGGIQVRSAPDRWSRVQRGRFERPMASRRGASIVDEIVRLVHDVVPGIRVTIRATSLEKVTALTWDRERADAVNDLATSIGAEVYFDVDGNLVVANAPLLSQSPVWTVDASASGVLLSGSVARERAQTYSVVIVSMDATDGHSPFPPQVVVDDDPRSPTFVNGPFGRVPYFYASPNVHNITQAQLVGRTTLNKVKAVNASVEVESVVHPGLDRGDVITITLPSGMSETHLIDSLTTPLGVGGTQKITTRSSRPDGEIPEGS